MIDPPNVQKGRPALIRVILLLNRRLRKRKQQDEEHAQNERVMAGWTRLVGLFTVVLAVCAIANVWIIKLQLGEMHTGGIDTHNLAIAAQNQASATGSLKAAGEAQAKALDRLRAAGEAQATAADKLRQAGEAQARAMDSLKGAGEAQARSTASLAENSGRQIFALSQTAQATQAQAAAARSEAVAIVKSADAAIMQSQAADRLAMSGKAQADATQASLLVARAANDITAKSSAAATRPWVAFQLPVGSHEPTAGQDYLVEPSMLNTGRSPAQSVIVVVSLEISPASSANISFLAPCSSGCVALTLFPTGESGGGAQQYHPRIDKDSMTQQVVSDLTTFNKVVVLRARADYLDSEGNHHVTLFCGFYAPAKYKLSAFTSCPSGNYAN